MTKFLLGFGVGVALGIMFAPAKGEETRARLREKAEEIANLPRKKAAELGEKIGRQTAEAVVEVVKQSVVGKDKSA